MASNSDSSAENKTSTKDAPLASSCYGSSSPDTDVAPTTNENHGSIAKTVDFGDLKDTITYDNFKNTSEKNTATPDDSKNTSTKNPIKNQTNAFESINNDLSIFAVIALLLVSLLVLI